MAVYTKTIPSSQHMNTFLFNPRPDIYIQFMPVKLIIPSNKLEFTGSKNISVFYKNGQMLTILQKKMVSDYHHTGKKI